TKAPKQYGYLYNLAIAYMQKNETARAIPLLEEALQINPVYLEAHYNLAMAYGKKGWIDKEIAHLQKVVALDKNYADAHYSLGIAYAQQGKVNEAVYSLRQAIALYPATNPWRKQAEEILTGLASTSRN
ncbi:MAG: tetratricopeptide repeat protein, partial [bacterium]|nr:tetratricopeptide repeat protein [bacterium]